ncbi:MAG: hypothetical protein QOF14_269 [Hyphomicrobiales bacterium]|jgi:hypothetical protein|nr:hypothetical protein [Hyphomicrobiales bacterium]
MNSINPHWIVVDIEPSIALARAECLQKYRAHPAEKPRAFDVMKDARVARSAYQRGLMRQFMSFLVSSLSLKFPAILQTSAARSRRA